MPKSDVHVAPSVRIAIDESHDMVDTRIIAANQLVKLIEGQVQVIAMSAKNFLPAATMLSSPD